MRNEADNQIRKAAREERVRLACEEIAGFLAVAKTPMARRALARIYRSVMHSKPVARKRVRDWGKKELEFKAANAASKMHATNSRQAWTGSHDDVVMNAQLPDVEIAKKLGRTVKSIRMRRQSLGKLTRRAGA